MLTIINIPTQAQLVQQRAKRDSLLVQAQQQEAKSWWHLAKLSRHEALVVQRRITALVSI